VQRLEPEIAFKLMAATRGARERRRAKDTESIRVTMKNQDSPQVEDNTADLKVREQRHNPCPFIDLMDCGKGDTTELDQNGSDDGLVR